VKVKERKKNNKANWRKKEKENERTRRLPMETSQQSYHHPASLPKKEQPPRSATASNINEKANGLSPQRKLFSEMMLR
jgi:hypothetical protein